MAKKRNEAAPENESVEKKATRNQVTLDEGLIVDIDLVCSILQISRPTYVNTRMGEVVADELPRLLATRGFKREPK